MCLPETSDRCGCKGSKRYERLCALCAWAFLRSRGSYERGFCCFSSRCRRQLQDAGRLSRLPFLIYDGQFRFVPRSRLSFGTGSTTDDDAQQPPLHPPPVPPSFPEVYELLTLSPRNSPEASPGVPIGTRIRILWPGHNLEYEGTVQETEGSLAKIAYEDGDMHCWHRLSDCQYQVLPLAESDPAGSDPATTAALPSNDVPAQPPQRKRRRSPLPPAAPRRLTVVLQGRPFAHSTAAGREVRPDGTVARPKGRSPRRGRWDPALGAWEIVADPTSTGLGPSPPPPAPSPPAPSWPAAATAMTPRKLASQPRWRVFGTGGRPATPWK